VVQLVLLILLLASGLSWYFIFGKMFAIRVAIREADGFENAFWSGRISTTCTSHQFRQAPVWAWRKSLRRLPEFLKLKRQGRMDISVVMDGTVAPCARLSARVGCAGTAPRFLARRLGQPYVGLFVRCGHHDASVASPAYAGDSGARCAGIAEALIATRWACSRRFRRCSL